MKLLADKIKELRTKENLTQEEFAEKIFVSREAVSKWERNRGIPDIDNLINISKLFDISIDTLLDNNDITKITLTNNKEISKMKRIQVISSSVIAACLVFLIIFGLINFLPEKSPKRNTIPSMPKGVLIGLYIDTKGDGNFDLKGIIEDNKTSNDVYLIKKDNSFISQGIHNLNTIRYRDYENNQCNIYLSKDIIETSKYYSVYYNYNYEFYEKPHGYSLEEITNSPLFMPSQNPLDNIIHSSISKYVIYDTELLSDCAFTSSYYFNVYAVENFYKMKISEFDEKYNEISVYEVVNGETYTLNSNTYLFKLYYSVDYSSWHQSGFGSFLTDGFGYNIDVSTQLVNNYGYVDAIPISNFKVIK